MIENDEQERWFAAHRDEIAARIEEGWASAQRGDHLTAEQVREEMRERKRAWLEERKSHRG